MNYYTSIKRTNAFNVTVYDAAYAILEFDAQVEMQRNLDDKYNVNDVGLSIYCSDKKDYKLKADICLVFSQLKKISRACGQIGNGITTYPLNPSNENIAIVNGDMYFMEVQLIKTSTEVTVDFVFRKQEDDSKIIVLEFKQKDFDNLTQDLTFLEQ